VVNVGSGGSVRDIIGKLTIDNQRSKTTLNVDDSADPKGRVVTLSTSGGGHQPWGTVSGLAPADIVYKVGRASVALRAGTGDDAFVFDRGASLPGTIDGGGGSNTLSYAAYNTEVKVNLAAGTATGAGGIANIRNVIGGQGGNILVGDARANILQGGAGRDLIIGGMGGDTINGGPGDDLLIGGSTRYDLDPVALDAIMAEWQSRDSYPDRILKLRSGVGSGGYRLVLNETVFDDEAHDSFVGGSGLDWFWAGRLDFIKDLEKGEKVN
jgi:Ca2+-binding RTX toxin-like protein